MKRLRILFSLLKQTFQEWNADHSPRLAAALAYYTAFALAPLLVIAIAIAGLLLGQQQVQERVLDLVGNTINADAATMVGGMIESAAQPREGLIATVIGVITLLFGAMGAFGQLQQALDVIWDVDERKQPSGVLGFVRSNLLNFGMVIFIGFLLLVSLVISTILAGVGQFLGQFIGAAFILQVLNLAISFGVVTLLFALVYKVLPHTDVRWRDVWVGAAFTTLLFLIGRFALSLYLANSGTASTYGAAGSFVVILLWIYYSAQILLFGAEFTQVFSSRYGTRSAAAMGSSVVASTSNAAANSQRRPIPIERAVVPVSPVYEKAPDPKPHTRFVQAVIVVVSMVGLSVIAALLPGRQSKA